MSAAQFRYVPGVTTQFGDSDATVAAQWVNFLEFSREFACLREDYTDTTPRQGAHFRCTRAQEHPLAITRIETIDGVEFWPNLLHPQWFDPMYEGLAARPGFVPNEIQKEVSA
jgi:hypothetical protein